MPVPSEEFIEAFFFFPSIWLILQSIFYELVLNYLRDLDYSFYFKEPNLVDEEHESTVLINLPWGFLK